MTTLVIGAGLLGLSTAQALIDRGESVTVLDAGDAALPVGQPTKSLLFRLLSQFQNRLDSEFELFRH